MTSAIRVQGRVIYALMMREVHTVYGTSRLGYLWALIDSMLGIMIFYCIRSIGGLAHPSGLPLIFFLLAGFIPFNIFKGTVSKCLNAVAGNKALLTFPQVTPLDLMLGRMVVLWGKELSSALLLTSVFLFWEDIPHFSNFPLLVYVLFAAPLLGLGVGLIAHAANVMFPVTEKIVPFVLRVMFFTSGLFFSLISVPSQILRYLWWNPVAQLIEILRSSLSEGYMAINYSIEYVSLVTLTTLCIGMLLERHVRRLLR